MNEIIVPGRFNGPTGSGNGGWTSGELATHLVAECPDNRIDGWPAIEVTLRQPPPLDTPLLLEESDGVTTATFGGAVIATGRVVEHTISDVDPVGPDEARAAESAYAGHVSHPFPNCFSCGPDREEGDGLRIFPGPVGDGRVAATWRPHPSLAEDWHTYVDATAHASVAATWAAIDCVGGWASDLIGRPMVLGRITARVDTLPVIGEEHVVVGAEIQVEGRKTFTAATLYDSDHRVVASAEHVWFAIDPAAFGA
ncbi:hypothetical protein [Nocardioides piscis]|uniref:Thioesterase family protein n=1 Tax=Nocardioides piscis TaxID=2714938 RepID=A0A6G7YC66_9ACTN|nr:hypothetical protein [Nocardioides piscis]QIK74412.1 hypothetical protein G7071_02125 [Nocardioides piscis]